MWFLRLFCCCIYILIYLNLTILANPFTINFPNKEEITNDDYIEIQNQLRSINLDPLLNTLYRVDQGYTTYDDIYSRCTKGIKQVLIDPKRGLFPHRIFEKIGEASDMCIVCCVPYDDRRPQLADSIPNALRNTGFNGYFLCLKGGFPNPTGTEIQYAGVPYSFKIFMMLEAYKLGFNKVIWIDSAALPLRDPTPLFLWLDETETLLMSWHHPDIWKYIFPETREILQELTGNDVLCARHICTSIFGLKMNSEKAQKLINQYYEMVKLGTPFLSCFPEEFVLTAILGQPEFSSWNLFPYSMLSWFNWHEGESDDVINKRRNEGYFFYLRRH